MPESPLGRALVIANPTAHSGKGAQGADFTERFLQAYEGATGGFELLRTQAARQAADIAAQAGDYDTVIALGGDGVIHEVVNGLVRLPREDRPALAIIPFGSGNDFAKTLGMTANDAQRALPQLLRGSRRHLDLGHVTSDATGEDGAPLSAHFMETLSFGMDAAIALDTTTKREAGTSQEGEELFMRSAIRIFAQGSSGYQARFSFDGGAERELVTRVFAVQNGPTYGGGFRICPDANPSDGLLDVCLNVRYPNTAHMLALLGLARFGRHTRSRVVELDQVRHLEIEFTGEEPPCQVDGERLTGTRYVVDVVPDALDVIVPEGRRW